jgi:hypothetical protein
MKCSNCNTEFDSKKCPNCRKDPQEPASDFRKRMYTTVAVILFVLSIVSSLLIVDLVKDYNSNTYNKVHNSASSNSNTSNYDNNSDQSTDYDNNDTDSDDDSYNEDNDNDNSDSDDNYSNDIFDDNGNIDDDLKELYNQKIDEYYENYGSSTTVTKYDINGDGVDELILSHGDVDSDWNNDIYDFSSGNASPVGTIHNEVTFYEPKDGNGIYSLWYVPGYQELSQITIDDEGRLNVKIIDKKELSGNSPEYQGNKIETYRLGDYLGEKDGSSEDYDSDTIEYYDMNRIVDTKNWEICVTEAYKTSDDYPNIKVKCTITNTSKSDKRFIMKGNVQAYADYKYYDGTGDWNNFVITSGDTVDTTLEFALTELSVDDIDSTDIYLSIEGTNIWLKSLQD